ncbi:MAG: SpoIIE family protein phosphatase [Candidatus Rifleibacteriota bacterium]
MKSHDLQKFYRSIAGFIIFFFTPVLFFNFAFSFFRQNSIELENIKTFNRISPWLKESSNFLEVSSFLATKFKNALNEAKDGKDFTQKANEISSNFNLNIGIVIWEPQKEVFLSNNLQRYQNHNWQRIGKILTGKIDGKISSDDYRQEFELRKVLGPHLKLSKISYYSKHFLKTDFLNNYASIWFHQKPALSVLILIHPESLNRHFGKDEFLTRIDKAGLPGESWAIATNGRFYSMSRFPESLISDQNLRNPMSFGKFQENGNYVVFVNRLSDGSEFIYAKKSSRRMMNKVPFLFAICHVFFILILFKQFSFQKLSGTIAVKKLIMLFIAFSNVLPLGILSFLSHQYLEQKRLTLIDQKRIESIQFIQQLENTFKNEIESFPEKVKKQQEIFLEKIANTGINLESSKPFIDWLNNEGMAFYFIASSTFPCFSYGGFQDKKQFISFNQVQDKSHRDAKKILELVSKISSCFISFWNNTTISQKTLTEIELVSDIAFQKPIDESLHMLVEIIDKIGYFGFGKYSEPSICSLMSVPPNDEADYLGIYQIKTSEKSKKFIVEQQNNRLANNFGLKVIFGKGLPMKEEEIFPFSNMQKLEPLIFGLSNYPPLEAGIISLNGEEWITTGFQSKIILDHRILALFPVSEIRTVIKNERNYLLMMILFDLLIIFALATLFSNNLLTPVRHLESAALAIKKHDFSHRLPSLGNDEFGYMGKILNEAIIDLEELGAAGIVQQQLFPKKLPDTGKFKMYGKCVSLNDLGGDYLDYFSIGKTGFAVLLGDVAGHGVGAAMIMAMVKSAILISEDLLDQPLKLASRLHQLIYEAKTKKQKKVMTFQYIFSDLTTGKLKISNAGGLPVMIVNGPEKRFRELRIQGAALGAFKNNRLNEMEFEILPGETLVLYSDGIVEARNSNEEMIGFDGLKELLIDCWHEDPEIYYKNVQARYEKWIENTGASDDMTILFLGNPIKTDQAAGQLPV